MRVVVVGAGVGGLAAALRLRAAGHDVVVLEQSSVPGGKAGRLERDGFRFDTGPSLLTMPWVLRDLFADTGAPLEDELDLVRVEPVTRYRFADGSSVELSADLPRAVEALEAWSPGAGDDWGRYLGVCAQMWAASVPFLTGPPPWPPRRGWAGSDGAPPPDPRDALRVRPWATVSSLARSVARDPRLRMIIERFATYAGGDPRRTPAALAVAGYVEHAFGAWHVRGGLYEIVRALERRLEGRVRYGADVTGIERAGRRVTGVVVAGGERVAADAVVWNGDAVALDTLLGRTASGVAPRSVSGVALMLGLRDRPADRVHHEIRFPSDYHAEFDDVFAGRLPRDPTLYLSTSCVTAPEEAPDGGENVFVLVNAPAGAAPAAVERFAAEVIDRLGVRDRIVVRGVRGPTELARETGALGGAIYGAAPHGRLATLRRPGPEVRGVRGLYRVGGTAHPGGGLPLVMLSGALVARLIGPA